MSGSDESAVERLRRQAERAIAAAQGRRVVEPILERLLAVAVDGSEESLFAHRHLAEYRIEERPWSALLHLRKVVAKHPDDDVVHALMGLSQALLGNFRCAVAAYRRALKAAPQNPWYHHNLGHLLDVGLDQPGAALNHLELAFGATDPPEHEIAASLAHCLARLGRIQEAGRLARDAVAAAPKSVEHRKLLEWIDEGAPPETDFPSQNAKTPTASKSSGAAGRAPKKSKAKKTSRADATSGDKPQPKYGDAVVSLLDRLMNEGGFNRDQIRRAHRMWLDYDNARRETAIVRDERLRAPRPDICAAAIEYAIARLHGVESVTRAAVARRYGVSPRSLSERWGDIQVVLSLKPADPRYAVRR